MFSELIDTVITRSGRPDRLSDATTYCNQTMRDVQASGYLYNNRVEDQIITDADPYLWTPPINFQSLGFLKYANGRYPSNRLGVNQEDSPSRYYAGPGYIGFTGHGAGNTVDVLYYKFQPRLQYFALADRPATWEYDFDTEQYVVADYHADYSATAVLQAKAQLMTSNWIIKRWKEMVEEGTLAKLFKLIGEDSRAAVSYTLFQQIRKEQFIPAELRESLPGQDFGNWPGR